MIEVLLVLAGILIFRLFRRAEHLFAHALCSAPTAAAAARWARESALPLGPTRLRLARLSRRLAAGATLDEATSKWGSRDFRAAVAAELAQNGSRGVGKRALLARSRRTQMTIEHGAAIVYLLFVVAAFSTTVAFQGYEGYMTAEEANLWTRTIVDGSLPVRLLLWSALVWVVFYEARTPRITQLRNAATIADQLGRAASEGAPVVDALHRAASACYRDGYAEIARSLDRLNAGDSLAEALRRGGASTRLVSDIATVGPASQGAAYRRVVERLSADAAAMTTRAVRVVWSVCFLAVAVMSLFVLRDHQAFMPLEDGLRLLGVQ